METKEFEIIIKTDEQGLTINNQTKNEILINSLKIDDILTDIAEDKNLLEIVEFYKFDEKSNKLLKDKIDLFNIYGLFLNFQCDLRYYINRLYLEKTGIEQNIQIRHIYNDLFRYKERFSNRENTIINRLCKKYNVDSHKKIRSKSLKEFNSKYEKTIYEKRNLFAAHNAAENDYLDNCNLMAVIEPTDVIQMCFQFLECERDFFKIIEALVTSLTEQVNEINKELKKQKPFIEENLLQELENRKTEITKEKYKLIKAILNEIFHSY